MKHTIILITLTAFLAACGGADTSDLGQQRAKLEQLKTTYKAYADSIKTIETWLVENDSTIGEESGRGPAAGASWVTWRSPYARRVRVAAFVAAT